MKAKLMRVPASVAAERRQIEALYNLSAREWFPYLRAKLLASRPVVGVEIDGDTDEVRPIYGAPTFRNVLLEDGSIV